MITVKINSKEETVTHSTLIKVGTKYISLIVTKYLYYAKPYHLDHNLALPKDLLDKQITLFEELFYWPLTHYIDPTKNHLAYTSMLNSNWIRLSEKKYEVQWEEIKLQLDPRNNLVLWLSNSKTTYPLAIPPKDKGERYDYFTCDFKYHFNCKQGEHEGIEIKIEDNKVTF